MTTASSNKRELLVAGFVRGMEKTLNIMNIPTEIEIIIYRFQQVCDEWNTKYLHERINVNYVGDIITFESYVSMTAYGCHVVEDGIFIWQIKILSISLPSDTGYPYIGIIKGEEYIMPNYTLGSSWEQYGYQYCAGSGYVCSVNNAGGWNQYENKWNKPDDILEIILDLNEQTVKLGINGKEPIVAFQDIRKGKYRLALSGCKMNATFQFL